MEVPPDNRRPLGSRQWAIFQGMSRFLSNKNVSPNAISISSIVFAAIAGMAFAATSRIETEIAYRIAWGLGVMFVQLRLIANLLDGLVAVEGGKASPTGELFNEVPDRISDIVIMAGLGCSRLGSPVLGLVAALISVFVAYTRSMGASIGVGQVFLGPMAKQHRMALISLVALGLAIAPSFLSQLVLDRFTVVEIALLIIIVGGCVTAWRRLAEIARRVKQH